MPAFSAFGKLSHDERQLKTMRKVGVPQGMPPFLAACEITAGPVVGTFYAPLGIAAALVLRLVSL